MGPFIFPSYLWPLYCSVFRNNTSLDDTRDKSAVAAFRFPTSFSGTNAFTDNVGGGITLLNAPMNANGTLLFENNIAVFGGGIAMDDRCLVSKLGRDGIAVWWTCR